MSDRRPCAHGRRNRCFLGEHLVSRASCARGFHVQLNAIVKLRGQGNSNGHQLLVQCIDRLRFKCCFIERLESLHGFRIVLTKTLQL
jgi:hypothetical protein